MIDGHVGILPRLQRRRDENPDDKTLELAEENLERADALAFLQFVRAVCCEAL